MMEFFRRSTPRVDSFWGGRNDLTSAVGSEVDGITTIAFRKKLKSNFLHKIAKFNGYLDNYLECAGNRDEFKCRSVLAKMSTKS